VKILIQLELECC